MRVASKILIFVFIFLIELGVASCIKAQAVEDGLVGHWQFDEDSGNTALDSSGNNNNNGTLVSGPTRETAANCKTGRCLGLDNNYVSTNLDVQPNAMTAATWSVWVYPTRVNHHLRQQIMSDDNGDFDRSILIDENSDKFSVFAGTLPNGVWRVATADINQWQHIAVVWKQDNIYFYKNGVEYIYGKAPIGQSTSQRLNFGYNPTFSGEYFQGRLDDARVYNRALSADEIKRLYIDTSSTEAPPAPLPEKPTASSRDSLIAYLQDRNLKVITKRGTDTRSLAEENVNPISSFVWSQDGQKILYHTFQGYDQGIGNWLVEVTSARKTDLSLQDDENCEFFSPDGSKLACYSKDSVFLMETATKSKKEIHKWDSDKSIGILGWSNDGEFIYFNFFQEDKYWRIKKDGSDLKEVSYTFLSASSGQINPDERLKCRDAYSGNLMSDTSGRVAIILADNQGNLQHLGIDKEKDDYEQYAHLRLSPDGRKIVYHEMAKNELWFYEVGSGKTELVPNFYCIEPSYPSWSADGKYILFTCGGELYYLLVDPQELETTDRDMWETLLIYSYGPMPSVYLPVWQPVVSVSTLKPTEPLEVRFDDLDKTLDTHRAPEELQNNWEFYDLLWEDIITQGKKVNMDILLKSKNPDLNLKPGDKVHVIFRLYDKVMPFSGYKFFEHLTGDQALLYIRAYEGEVINLKGFEDKNVIQVKDVVFSPAIFPDEINTKVIINIENQGLIELEKSKEFSVAFNTDISFNCAYGLIDASLAYLAGPMAMLTVKKAESLKDAVNLGKGFYFNTESLVLNLTEQNYLEAGKSLFLLGLEIGKEFFDPLKFFLTGLEYLTRAVDCVQLVGWWTDFITGFQVAIMEAGKEAFNAVILESPASLMVNTADGKKIGFDETGNIVNELGENGGVSAGHPALVLFQGVQPFEVVVLGQEQGTYNLTVFQGRENELARINYSNVPTKLLAKAIVKLDPQSKEEPQLAIDENNDGQVETYKKPDKFEFIVPAKPAGKATEKPTESQNKTKIFFYLFGGLGLVAAAAVGFVIFRKKIFKVFSFARPQKTKTGNKG